MAKQKSHSYKKDNGQETLMSLPIVNNAHYIKDLSFENPGIIKNLIEPGTPPQISINIQVQAQPLEERVFEIVLLIEAKAHQEKENMFLIELSYGGIFTVNECVDEADIKPLLLIECAHLLFPFARAIVANITREGGLPPLVLNSVDFAALYRQAAEADETNPSHKKH